MTEKTKFNKVCIVCGVKFTTKDKNKLYCCEGCKIIGEKEQSNKKLASNNIINKLTTHKCRSCGKKFMSMKATQELCSNCL